MVRPFPRLLSLLLILSCALATTGAQACEKHLQGHQQSSDSASEASQR
mgnify:FL=1